MTKIKSQTSQKENVTFKNNKLIGTEKNKSYFFTTNRYKQKLNKAVRK